MSFPELIQTKYGFQYGEALVERVMSDDKYGVVIRVAAASDPYGKYVDVRVSPKGRLVRVVP
jgi:hypothetical protein